MKKEKKRKPKSRKRCRVDIRNKKGRGVGATLEAWNVHTNEILGTLVFHDGFDWQGSDTFRWIKKRHFRYSFQDVLTTARRMYPRG